MIELTKTLTNVLPASWSVSVVNGIPHFSKMANGGIEFDLGPWTSFIECDLEDLATTTLDGNDFNYAVTQDDDSISVVCTGKAPYQSIVFTCLAFRDAITGLWNLDVSCPSHTTGLRLAQVRWPYLLIKKHRRPDKVWINWPQNSGFTVTEPHLSTKVGLMACPGSMQFFSMYRDNKEHIYVSTNDEEYNTKIWQFMGKGDAGTLFWLTHFPDGAHHTTNLGYSQPFNISVELYRGKVAGIRGHFDDALKYRKWATKYQFEGGRPWMTRTGGWRSWAPLNIRNATIMARRSLHAYDVLMASETTKIRAFVGAASKSVDWYYDWSEWLDGHNFEFTPPDYNFDKVITGVANNGSGMIRCTSVAHGLTTNTPITIQGTKGVPNAWSVPATPAWLPTVIDADHFDLQGSVFAGSYLGGGGFTRVGAMRSNVKTAWTSMKAGGVHPAPYLYFNGWHAQAAGKYKFDTFFYQNPSSVCLRNLDGSYVEGPAGLIGNTVAELDHAQNITAGNQIRGILQIVIAEIINEMGGIGVAWLPDVLYVDAYDNFIRQNADPARPNWKTRDFNAGMRLSYTAIIQTWRVVAPGVGSMTEWATEHMLGTDGPDVMFLSGNDILGVHALNNCFANVYGRHVRCWSFETYLVANDIGQTGPLLASQMFNWHVSGCVNYSPSGTPTLVAGSTPTLGVDPLFFVFDWWRQLELAKPVLSPYMSGQRMRPMWVDSAEAEVLEYGEDVPANLVNHNDRFFVQDSTWMDPDTSRVAGVLTHHSPIIAEPTVGFTASQPHVRKFKVVADDYDGLGAGLKTVYKRVFAAGVFGARVEIGQFYDAFEGEVTITPWTIVLIEVHPAEIKAVTEL